VLLEPAGISSELALRVSMAKACRELFVRPAAPVVLAMLEGQRLRRYVRLVVVNRATLTISQLRLKFRLQRKECST